jgi:hypothetical protein
MRGEVSGQEGAACGCYVTEVLAADRREQRPITARGWYLGENLTALHAEYVALINGMKVAMSHKVTDIHIVGTSTYAIDDLLAHPPRDSPQLLDLHTQALHLKGKFATATTGTAGVTPDNAGHQHASKAIQVRAATCRLYCDRTLAPDTPLTDVWEGCICWLRCETRCRNSEQARGGHQHYAARIKTIEAGQITWEWMDGDEDYATSSPISLFTNHEPMALSDEDQRVLTSRAWTQSWAQLHAGFGESGVGVAIRVKILESPGIRNSQVGDSADDSCPSH